MNSPKRTELYPARDARQGEIILKTMRSRIIFVAGLLGVVVAASIAAFLTV